MNKTKKIFVVVVLLIIILISLFAIYKSFLNDSLDFAKPVGNLKIFENHELQSNINTFMESQTSAYTLGKENYYCSNKLYGYDDKYAYAWVYCSGFTIKDNGGLEQGTAFSIPTRFEYINPHFEIFAFQQPRDGNFYDSSLSQLFPKKFYAQASQIATEKFERAVRNKAKAVLQVKAKHPELKDYPFSGLPPRSLVIEEDNSGIYLAFIQNGSGIPILDARCFIVKPDNTIIEKEKFVSTSPGDYLYFSARECKQIY